MAKEQMSAMAQRFGELKTKHKDAIILFRRDGSYEAYYEDAKAVADVCGTELKRENGNGGYMTGFPCHALDTCLPKLVRAGKRIAICDEVTNNENKEDETMRLNLNANKTSESVNVQAAAPVMNPVKAQEPAIEDAVVIEEIEDTVPARPVAKPVTSEPKTEEKPKPKRGTDGKFAKKEAPKAEGGYSVETYTTKRGGTAALIFGFSSQEDADKIAAKMAKSIGSSWRWDADRKEKRYAVSVGTRYVDVAKRLCDALNKGDKAAVDKACKDSVDIYNGVVEAGKAEREARKAERESKKSTTAKAEPANPRTYTEAEVRDLMKRVIAGDAEAMTLVDSLAA